MVKRLRYRVHRNFREGDISNALIALDETHEYVPGRSRGATANPDLKKLKEQIVESQKTSRKYGIGWMFISQRTADFDKSVYSQLEDHIFCWGLNVGADKKSVKNLVGKEMFDEYRNLPNPKQSGMYTYMITGGIVGVGTIGTPLIVEGFSSMEEMIRSNNLEER